VLHESKCYTEQSAIPHGGDHFLNPWSHLYNLWGLFLEFHMSWWSVRM